MRLSIFALTLAGASAFVQPALRTTSKLATSKVAPAQMMLEPSSVMQTTNLLAGVVAVGALQFPRNSAAHATAAYATAAYANSRQCPAQFRRLRSPLTQPPLTPFPR